MSKPRTESSRFRCPSAAAKRPCSATHGGKPHPLSRQWRNEFRGGPVREWSGLRALTSRHVKLVLAPIPRHDDGAARRQVSIAKTVAKFRLTFKAATLNLLKTANRIELMAA